MVRLAPGASAVLGSPMAVDDTLLTLLGKATGEAAAEVAATAAVTCGLDVS